MLQSADQGWRHGWFSLGGEFGRQIGDSIVVTEAGCDCLADYPCEIPMAGG
ncbi:MAG: hypothetical protein OEZ03_00695 [Alphaproteobacteria bacterium]|nr:hypothetical protein [Alphaproteobacteria bacterium]